MTTSPWHYALSTATHSSLRKPALSTDLPFIANLLNAHPRSTSSHHFFAPRYYPIFAAGNGRKEFAEIQRKALNFARAIRDFAVNNSSMVAGGDSRNAASPIGDGGGTNGDSHSNGDVKSFIGQQKRRSSQGSHYKKGAVDLPKGQKSSTYVKGHGGGRGGRCAVVDTGGWRWVFVCGNQRDRMESRNRNRPACSVVVYNL